MSGLKAMEEQKIDQLAAKGIAAGKGRELMEPIDRKTKSAPHGGAERRK